MNKTEQNMCAAFSSRPAGIVRVGKNTEVSSHAIYLHSHCIAWRESGGLCINLCGWNTITTRSRINALLSDLGYQSRVRTRAGQAYITGGDPAKIPISADQTVKITR